MTFFKLYTVIFSLVLKKSHFKMKVYFSLKNGCLLYGSSPSEVHLKAKIHLHFKMTFFNDHFLMKKNVCKYIIY